jgi:hypothetical protein
MVWQKNYGAPGTAPGTLAPPPDVAPHVLVTAVHYTEEDYTETQVTDLRTYLQTAPQHGVFWFNIDGLGDIQVIETLGAHFDLFESVRLRLRQAHSKLRQSGADYLAYALLRYGD